MKFFTETKNKLNRGFSLVEVVLSLAITSFTLVALLALFVGGVQTTKESAFDINAANLASSLIAIRRDMPTNTDIKQQANSGHFILPPVAPPTGSSNWPTQWPDSTNLVRTTNGIQGTNLVDINGYTNQGFTPFYRIAYEVQTNSVGVSSLYLSLSHPANITNVGRAPNRYEVFTYIRVP